MSTWQEYRGFKNILRGLLFKWSFCKFCRRLSYNKGGVQTNKKWNQTLFATPNRTNYCFEIWPYSGAFDIRSSLKCKLLSIVHIGFALSSLMWGDWIGWNGHLTKHGIRFRCRQNAQLNKTRQKIHKFQIANYSALYFIVVSLASMPFYLPMSFEGDPMKMQSGFGYFKHTPV